MDQPKTPTGTVKAKTPCLVTFLDMKKAAPEKKRQGWNIYCAGNKGHYRKDGSCVHVDLCAQRLKSDWHRRRTRWVPWGNYKNTAQRLPKETE